MPHVRSLPRRSSPSWRRVLPEILAQHPSIQRPHPLTESWERRHFYAALNAAFAKARGPLLLLIDDLQWCDADSFEWLHSLFRSDSAPRILVVGTVRAEETGRTHPLAGAVERSAPVRAGRGTPALAADRRRDRGIGGSGGQPPARYGRFGRPLPRDEGQSAFRGGECARRIARPECESCRRLGHRNRAAPHSRRDYRAPGAAFGSGLRTGRTGQRLRTSILHRSAGQGHATGTTTACRRPWTNCGSAASSRARARATAWPNTISPTTVFARSPTPN